MDHIDDVAFFEEKGIKNHDLLEIAECMSYLKIKRGGFIINNFDK